MPIKIPNELPAVKTLAEENIFVMTETRAITQDIRPLKIIVLNLMPKKITTETQLSRILGNTPLQIELELVRTATHVSQHVPEEHMLAFYKTFDDIRDGYYDGMIITGAPVEHLPFEEVDYWDELLEIMAFAQRRVYSTLYICWAAQAALYHFYGIPKHPLPAKVSGVFEHGILHPECRLFRGFDDTFPAPHSRHTEVRAADAAAVPELRLLARSEEAGLALLERRDHSQVFMTGHLEYDRDTLDAEYRRDRDRGLDPQIPQHYYPGDNPDNVPHMYWRAHAHLFYSNWLNYYVYQETPFSLSAIVEEGMGRSPRA